MLLHFSPSRRSSSTIPPLIPPTIHPLDAVLFNATAIYKRRGGTTPGTAGASTNGFRICERTYPALLCFLVSISPTKSRGVLEDGPGASASANTRLSSSRTIHLYARGEIISVTRNTPAAAGKLLARTQTRTDYLYIRRVLFRRLPRETFWETRIYTATLKTLKVTVVP